MFGFSLELNREFEILSPEKALSVFGIANVVQCVAADLLRLPSLAG